MIVNFSFATTYGEFSDSLTLDDDITYTQDQINQMQQDRLNTWLGVMANPPQAGSTISNIQNVNGILYQRFMGAPTANQTLVKLDGVWYHPIVGA